MDRLTPQQRSKTMQAIRGRNTQPELWLRKRLFARGYRYRLHQKTLPGKPDLVFSRYKAVIFVNGCFWHGHHCSLNKRPLESLPDFWIGKIARNIQRDKSNISQLLKLGWRVCVFWQCAIKGKSKLSEDQVISSIKDFLEGESKYAEILGYLNDGKP